MDRTVTTLVPTESEFNNEDYLDAPELQSLATQLIEKYPGLFNWIPSLRLTYLWKRKASKYRGRIVAGQVQKTPKLMRHFVTTEWVIWIAADQFIGADVTDIGIEQTLFHELLHLIENPKTGKATLRAHDHEYFTAEAEQYPGTCGV